MDFFTKKIQLISLELNPMTFPWQKNPEAVLKSIFWKTVESRNDDIELRLEM